MKLSDFDYDLPEEFIAQTAAEPRDSAKLLVYNRASGKIEDKHFYDILQYLKSGDVLVLNTTKVRKARLFGYRCDEAKIEVFLLKELEKNEYEVLLRPARKIKIGDEVIFGAFPPKPPLAGNQAKQIIGTCLSKDIIEGTAVMKFDGDVEKFGIVPLPPYIHSVGNFAERYQTIYSKQLGSCAAPTAGLHWTKELLEKAKAMGVRIVEVLLHVGLGTFRPVKVERIEEHKMHSEYYEVGANAAKEINDAKKEGRRVICCGTTSVRTVESVWQRFGEMRECVGETEIFIYPPFEFKVCDAMITNFHLPKSTLLMLVAAFIGGVRGGTPRVKEIYNHAKSLNYRFFSFGDVCFLC